MKPFAALAAALAAAALATLSAPGWAAGVSVLTQDYDIGRSGANLSETTLTPANVNSAGFGRLYAYAVDDEVFAQPLYVPGVSIGGVAHNIVYLASMGNTVYAYDADNPATSNTPLWSHHLSQPVPSSKYTFIGGSGVVHNGIYSTPVIDPGTDTIYIVTHNWATASQSVSMSLHALDITTGAEKFGGPVAISAPSLIADVAEQRAGLLLLNGVVYVPFASHADLHVDLATQKKEAYVGMVLGFNAGTLALNGIFNAEPGGMGASLWQGGRGLASDGTAVYGMTANAQTIGSSDYSESFLQFNASTLALDSSFQDPDAACLNQLDLDLASAGPQVVTGTQGTQILLGGGKEGKVYEFLLDGGTLPAPSYFWGTTQHPTLPAEGGTCVDHRGAGVGWLQGSDTAFWTGPSFYYSFGNEDQLISWHEDSGTFNQSSANVVTSQFPNALALSANGATDGILWTVARQTTGPAIFSAYNALPSNGQLALLWNSAQLPKRDALGLLGRYSVPTIANGKVYVGTGSNQVGVYGLLPSAPALQVTPTTGTMPFIALDSNWQNIYVNALGGYSGTVTLTVTGVPAGVTVKFAPASVTLSSTATQAVAAMTVNPANATLPLKSVATLNVKASGSGGLAATTPVRLYLRNAIFTSESKANCNSSNQMAANLAWQIDGSGTPSIWIQDPASPTFPGRLWTEPVPAIGSGVTANSVDNATQNYYYWIIDQSAGIAANFDNALRLTNLDSLYSCP